jgi:hypothetical protein
MFHAPKVVREWNEPNCPPARVTRNPPDANKMYPDTDGERPNAGELTDFTKTFNIVK